MKPVKEICEVDKILHFKNPEAKSRLSKGNMLVKRGCVKNWNPPGLRIPLGIWVLSPRNGTTTNALVVQCWAVCEETLRWRLHLGSEWHNRKCGRDSREVQSCFSVKQIRHVSKYLVVSITRSLGLIEKPNENCAFCHLNLRTTFAAFFSKHSLGQLIKLRVSSSNPNTYH